MAERHTLPDDTRVGQVALQIADLERSLAFYRDVIGFHVVEQSDGVSRRWARLGPVGTAHPLLELREKPGVRHVPPRGLLGLYHFAVLLPSRGDLGRLYAHAVNAGAQVASADHLVSEALYLVDPDGLTIEVYRDRPRGEWRYANGELRMASLPLDIDAVVGAGEDGPAWLGLPAGTTIGHMHFYVGDLPTAEAFYVRALGFAPVVRSYPGALFVSAGGYHHHVGLNTWASTAPAATDNDARLVSWELVVRDPSAVDAAATRLRDAGYTVVTAHDTHAASDPWGNTVSVVTG